MLRHRTFETAMGTLAIVASPDGVRQVILPDAPAAMAKRIRQVAPDSQAEARLLPGVVAALRRYFDGRRVDFDFDLDFGATTGFTRDVLEACAAIRYGETATYGELAARVGRPGAARAVGTAMSKNPLPILVPCHRVTASGGRLGGYSGPEGVRFKERLLYMEARGTAAAQRAREAAVHS